MIKYKERQADGRTKPIITVSALNRTSILRCCAVTELFSRGKSHETRIFNHTGRG
ncbi:MAG: hypothetical protein PHC49_08805 [Desulfuromonadaceae bacterium]|nr:hypothetical protein [Desulfuromonadaceae bacterium]